MSATDTRPEFVPATDEVLYERRDAVAILTFNRPQARNALTWPMYEALYAACEHVDADERVRVLVLRGAGDKAFVSGTDISQFRAFSTPEDAIEYEQNNNRYAGRLEDVRKPTIAMLRGYCVGGGAAIAMACDLRIGSPDVKFGVPIARTLGNTLSSHNLVRLVSLVGPARAKDILFTARFVDANEAKSVGLLTRIADADELDTRTLELAQTIAGHAPLTIRSTKEGINRIVKQWRLEESEDLLLMCYMSEDFKEGVEAFLAKRPANWQGR
jgi:enoyl-CoA hydratase/carnithine racemase